jgi:hypothetical protein
LYFHDESYLRTPHSEYKQNVKNKLKERIQNCIREDKPLLCIGYHLPGFNNDTEKILPLYIAQAVYFYNCQFLDEVNLFRICFKRIANFAGTKFLMGVNLKLSIFEETAYFVSAKFFETVDFGSAYFKSLAIFDSVEFICKEVYFTNVEFKEKVGFNQSQFYGNTYYRSTKFHNDATFCYTDFYGKADFKYTEFYNNAIFNSSNFFCQTDFSVAKFLNEVRFSAEEKSNIFNGETLFNYTVFERPNKTVFDTHDLSEVSFAGSDISKVIFTDKVRWGEPRGLTIIEEKQLKDKDGMISLNLALSIYRNLRENYEFRLQYDKAGQFFIKEMELKRNYRTVHTKDNGDNKSKDVLKKNNWFRRHFSLTGLYYHLSDYGESIIRPTLIGIITVGLSTLFWSMQASPTLLPTFSTNAQSPYSSFTGLSYNITDHTHLLKAFERSLGDFLPLLPSASDIKIGVIDYIIKIVGGALTFGLLAIALRRKFERKYTR